MSRFWGKAQLTLGLLVCCYPPQMTSCPTSHRLGAPILARPHSFARLPDTVPGRNLPPALTGLLSFAQAASLRIAISIIKPALPSSIGCSPV